ncbi:cytochrome P450 2F3-like [Ptychodera flava]|uniref:cytochrome P450 2F3-like n=1 Tax=Ptychodera flava TaxID=63121 RepID=UPI00396A8E0A
MYGMLDLTTFLVAITTFMLGYWLSQKLFAKDRNLPPGPPSLPLVGNLFTVAGKRPLAALRDLAAKYGDVFTIRLGSQLVLILNSHEAVREALVRKADDFVGRPVFPATVGTLNNGMVFSNGSMWKFKRRLLLRYLRTFGMGKSSMEKRIIEECKHLLHEFGEHEGQPFDPAKQVSNAASNIICSIVVGRRFEYSDSRFKTCLAALESLFQLGKIFLGVGFMNSLAGKMCDYVLARSNFKCHTIIYEVFEPFIEEHAETYDPDDMRDFIDVFLSVTKEWESEVSVKSDESVGERGMPFKYYYIYCLILDMFAAGTETTSTTLMWAWLLMMKYPDVQYKVQEEIDRVVGKHRFPVMSDGHDLPYTEATVAEVLRIAGTVPLSVPHWTVNDTSLFGYDIPKDTMVWPNLWSVLREPQLWLDPEKFDPTRFIDSQGAFSKPDTLIPFGTGPRICIGEQLAKMELFLTFTSVLQNYKLESDEKWPLPDLEGQIHMTLQPKKYKMRAIKR